MVYWWPNSRKNIELLLLNYLWRTQHNNCSTNKDKINRKKKKPHSRNFHFLQYSNKNQFIRCTKVKLTRMVLFSVPNWASIKTCLQYPATVPAGTSYISDVLIKWKVIQCAITFDWEPSGSCQFAQINYTWLFIGTTSIILLKSSELIKLLAFIV